MSTVLENLKTSNSYGKRLHVKGASEIVMGCCSHYLDLDGNVKDLTDEMKCNLENVITEYAKELSEQFALVTKIFYQMSVVPSTINLKVKT